MTRSVPERIAWDAALRQRIQDNVSNFQRRTAVERGRRAGVAIVVMADDDGEASLPLFMRTSGLSRHAAQMGLPGGRADDEESAVNAALRELEEELGIRLDSSAVLGQLDDFFTRSGFVITPIVVWSDVRATALRPSPIEIEQLFIPSLADVHGAVAASDAGIAETFRLNFSWGHVYAPTGALLYQFSEVGLDGRTTRVQDFYQPPFTWR